MKTQKEIVAEYLTHPDSWYFDFSDKNSEELEMKVSDQPFEGIALSGPQKVDITKQSKVPTVFLSQASAMRQWKVIPYANTKIVSVNLDNGEVLVKHAFQTGKRRYTANTAASGSGTPPSEEDATSINTRGTVLDMAYLMGVEWSPARYIFRVINFDWQSNPVEVALVDPHAPTKQSTIPVEEALESISLGRKEGSHFPDFAQSNNSPLLNGQKVAIKLAAEIEPGKPVLVYGSFDLPLCKDCMVAQNTEPIHSEENAVPAQKVPDAIVPLALYFARLDELHPRLVKVNYPVYYKNVQPGGMISGHFAIDANAHLNEHLPAGQYLVYLVGGKEMSEPAPLLIK